MPTKACPMRIKAAGPDDELGEGQFTAYASVFDVVDSVGDVVVKGAFTDTLAAWASSGAVVPLLWGHNLDDPDYNVGHLIDAAEDDHGLLVSGQLDLDAPKARQVYRLLKGRRVNQMSFAYDIDASRPVTVDGAKATALQKLRLHEVSIVPLGANSHTEVLTVKSSSTPARPPTGMKVGRMLSNKNETVLRDVLDLLDQAAEQVRDLLPSESTDADATAATAMTGSGGTGHDPDGPDRDHHDDADRDHDAAGSDDPGDDADDDDVDDDPDGSDGSDRSDDADSDAEGSETESGDQRPRRRRRRRRPAPGKGDASAARDAGLVPRGPADVRLLASLETLRLD